jgi:hypothetical protein
LRLQALESPLLVAVAAGSVALPTLLKLSDVLAAQKQDLSIGHQLPVEVELGKVRKSASMTERNENCPSVGCGTLKGHHMATWSRLRSQSRVQHLVCAVCSAAQQVCRSKALGTNAAMAVAAAAQRCS